MTTKNQWYDIKRNFNLHPSHQIGSEPLRILIDFGGTRLEHNDILDVLTTIGRQQNHTFILTTNAPKDIAYFLHVLHGEYYKKCPYRNLHIYTKVENQAQADESIPELMKTPAAVRGVMLKPVGEIDLNPWLPQYEAPIAGYDKGLVNGPGPFLNSVILEGGDKPLHPDRVRKIRDQCREAEVPFFFGGWGPWASIETLKAIGKYKKVPSKGLVYLGNGCEKTTMANVGAEETGRLLDGKEHNDLP